MPTLQTTIQRIDLEAGGQPLRCSGCGFPPSKQDATGFLTFGMPLSRGVIITKESGAVVTYLDSLILCGRCVAAAWVLLDPYPLRTAREKVELEKQQLQQQITELTQTLTKIRAEIQRDERQLEKQRAAREELQALRQGVTQWVAAIDGAIEPFRKDKLRYWALETASRNSGYGSSPDEKAETAEELAEAKERYEQTRGTLRKLKSAGERLEQRSEKQGLIGERAQLLNRLTALRDLDDLPRG